MMNPSNPNPTGKTTRVTDQVFTKGKNKGQPKSFMRIPDHRCAAWADKIKSSERS